MLGERAGQLPRLIQPHIGDHVADAAQLQRFAQLIEQAPALAPRRSRAGARARRSARGIVVDPWSDRLVLDRIAGRAARLGP